MRLPAREDGEVMGRKRRSFLLEVEWGKRTGWSCLGKISGGRCGKLEDWDGQGKQGVRR